MGNPTSAAAQRVVDFVQGLNAIYAVEDGNLQSAHASAERYVKRFAETHSLPARWTQECMTNLRWEVEELNSGDEDGALSLSADDAMTAVTAAIASASEDFSFSKNDTDIVAKQIYGRTGEQPENAEYGEYVASAGYETDMLTCNKISEIYDNTIASFANAKRSDQEKILTQYKAGYEAFAARYPGADNNRIDRLIDDYTNGSLKIDKKKPLTANEKVFLALEETLKEKGDVEARAVIDAHPEHNSRLWSSTAKDETITIGRNWLRRGDLPEGGHFYAGIDIANSKIHRDNSKVGAYDNINLKEDSEIEATTGGMAGLVNFVSQGVPENVRTKLPSLSAEEKTVNTFVNDITKQANNPSVTIQSIETSVHEFAKLHKLGKPFETYFIAGIKTARMDGMVSPDEITGCLCEAGQHVSKGFSSKAHLDEMEHSAGNFLKYRDMAVKGEDDLRERLEDTNPSYQHGMALIINKM